MSLSQTGGELAIERRYPVLRGRLQRSVLTNLPTAVERLAPLNDALTNVDLWIKRDDRSSPIYGGNKPRKLELILGAAVAAGRQQVLTTGGIGTHHGLATALCARELGLDTILVLLRQPVTEHVRRCLLLDYAAGAQLHWSTTVPALAARALSIVVAQTLRGRAPYIIPTGGSSTLGTLGYVNAGFELAEQIARGEMPEPGQIFVPMGSGGTVAGLALGLSLAGLQSRVVAVVVTDILPPSAAKLRRMAGRAARHLRRLGAEIPAGHVEADRIELINGYVGAGYGHPTDAGRQARDLLRTRAGITLDTTYSAKALAALIDRAATAGGGQPWLFWNTYSSIDPAAALGPLPDHTRLPAGFHRFFEGPALTA